MDFKPRPCETHLRTGCEMTAALDPIIASARIVAPEEAAITSEELALMRIFLGVARLAGTPLHIVQFADGVAAMVAADPNDTGAWQALLTKTHAAAIAGYIGPVHLYPGEDE